MSTRGRRAAYGLVAGLVTLGLALTPAPSQAAVPAPAPATASAIAEPAQPGLAQGSEPALAGSLALASGLAAIGQPCPLPPALPTLRGTRPPVVFVHGWTGSGGDWGETITGLQQRLGDRFDYLTFDYSKFNTDWAAHPGVAACLADYIHGVFAAHRAAGGTGKVLVVAHSMGGLATLFASSQGFAPNPVTSEQVGGLIAVGTPFLGSPFGNSPLADLKEFLWVEVWEPLRTLPRRYSDAATCLARHDSTHTFPKSCVKPPSLATGIPLQMIATTTTIHRTLFGAELYAISLGSDGVVNANSAGGYVTKEYDTSIRRPTALKQIECDVTSDQTLAALKVAAKGGTPLGAVIALLVTALGRLAIDNRILDEILRDEPGILLGTLLLASALVHSCGHSNSVREPRVLDQIAASLRDYAGPAATTTAPTPSTSTSSGTTGVWPSRDNEGPPALWMWFGASFLDVKWVSCDKAVTYCLAQYDNRVHLFKTKGIVDLGSLALDIKDPGAALRDAGLSATVVTEMLAPGRP